jgi:hypothetical protein
MGNFLSGYKTYITSAAAGITIALQQMGVLTPEQAQKLLEALGILLAVFIRMGVATATAVASTQLAVTTGIIPAAAARGVSMANPPPTPPATTLPRRSKASC